MSTQVEVDYILNLKLGDLNVSDVRKIEMSMVRIASDLNRIFPNSPISKIAEDIERVIMLARQAQTALIGLEAALVPGAGWIQMLTAATMATSLGISAYDTVRTGV
jgi:hypothetical protein